MAAASRARLTDDLKSWQFVGNSWMDVENPNKTHVSKQQLAAPKPTLPIWKQKDVHMGVSKNRDTPKWMVYKAKAY